jgi:hypothetical protein
VTDERVLFARAGVDIDQAHEAGVPGVHLVLALEPRGIEVALEVPVGELRAVRGRLADPERALELTAALEALPEQFTMSVSGEGAPLAASRATVDDARALLDRAEAQRRSFSVGWSVSRDVALEHAAVLDEQLEDAIVALGSTFALLADGGPAAPSAGARPARDADAARRSVEEERQGGKRRGRALHRERERDREREPDAEPEPVREREPAAKLPRVLGNKLLRAGLRRRPAGESRPADDKIDKGSRVRVLEGPFAGKTGVVQDLDGKGGARVMLGLLAVRLAVADLAVPVESRNRPLLSSSHRKPVPVRS